VNILYVTLLAVATLIWGYIFYKKDYHPRPLKVLAQVFIIGFFAMVPVFAYKYIYQNFLPELAEYRIFKSLVNSFILNGLFYFLANLIILSAILFIISGMITGILTFFRHEIFVNIKKSIKDEGLGFIAVSVIIGLLVCIESLSEKIFGAPVINTAIGSILFLSIIEEYIKHLIVRFTDDKKLKDIDDAITLSIMVGLSFSLIETFIYAYAGGGMSLIIYRALLSMPVHIVASGIFGYYYGLAHFAKPMVRAAGGEKTYKLNLKWLHRILSFRKSTVYEEEKITEGLFFAALFHAMCNGLFELNLAFAVVPILMIGLFALSHLYKKSHTLYRLLHAQ
jgi:RsiW-degrading membrane proteinase PrsW (M82 family)